tara:strand:+ start:122 stop:829 length:708 start_codon:yes stop_codon:yes gene_type:complete
MSRIRADKILDRAGTGSVELTQGATLPSGKTLSGSGTIAVNSSGTSAGLTGTPSITVADITGIGANLSGIATVATGARVTAGGLVVTAGISTLSDGADIEGFKVEDGQTAATPNGEFNFYLASGHFFRYTGTPGADYFPNFKHSASIDLNDRMETNDVVTATLAVNSPATTYHIANTIHIDGNATGENSYTIDTDWVGGSAPDAGNGSGHDVYSFTIVKTADKTFLILANALAAA